MAEGTNPNGRPVRIVPPTFGELELTFVGTSPLLMNATTFIDPMHPLTREFADRTAKRASTRTIDDHMMISKVEWRGRLNYDEQLGPYMPSDTVKGSLMASATRFKLGAAVGRGLIPVDYKVPLIYDGPRDIEGMWEAGYRDIRPAKNAGKDGGRVNRTRPCFDQWKLMTTVAWNPGELDVDRLWQIGDRAGFLGIGDYRPEKGGTFGMYEFSMKVLKEPRKGEDGESRGKAA